MLKKTNSKWSSKVAPVKRALTGKPKKISSEELQNLIRTKAYELYCKRGYTTGDPLRDWLTAESQVKTQFKIR